MSPKSVTKLECLSGSLPAFLKMYYVLVSEKGFEVRKAEKFLDLSSIENLAGTEGKPAKQEMVRKQTHRQTLDPSQAIFIIHIANL